VIEELTSQPEHFTQLLAFVQAWQAVTDQSERQGMQQRIYQLETVEPLLKADGYFRQASLAENNFLISCVKPSFKKPWMR
jgi:hypothetical protein